MKRPHQELAESAVLDLAGRVPGMSTAVKVMQLAFRHQAERRASEFFTRLSVAIGARDAEEAAQCVAQSIHEDWASEAVERGYQRMMSTIDEMTCPTFFGPRQA